MERRRNVSDYLSLGFCPSWGVAILLIGIFGLLEEFIPNMPSVWPLILMMFGVLIILAAYYRPRR